MYLATTECAFRARGSHLYRYIGKIMHVSRRRTIYLFLPRTIRQGKTILWNCRPRNHGTLKEPTEPKEMTVFIITAFG